MVNKIVFIRLEVFQEKRFCKPKVGFLDKLFGRKNEEENFKETRYFSGDIGCMILLLNSIKKWHSKINGHKSPELIEKYENILNSFNNYYIYIIIFRSSHKIFDLKTLIFELKQQKTLKE